MKHIILLVLVLVVSTSYAQEQKPEYNTTISFYTSINRSTGFEVRKSFTKTYLTVQLERFTNDNIDYNEVALGTGLSMPIGNCTVTSGVRAGLLTWRERTSALIGADLGVESKVADNLIIGLKYILNSYVTSIKSELPQDTGLYVRIGYQFNTSGDLPYSGGRLFK